MVLQALVEMKVDEWKSGYASVHNVLRHLQRKSGGYGTPSYASVEWYARMFVIRAGLAPPKIPSALAGS